MAEEGGAVAALQSMAGRTGPASGPVKPKRVRPVLGQRRRVFVDGEFRWGEVVEEFKRFTTMQWAEGTWGWYQEPAGRMTFYTVQLETGEKIEASLDNFVFFGWPPPDDHKFTAADLREDCQVIVTSSSTGSSRWFQIQRQLKNDKFAPGKRIVSVRETIRERMYWTSFAFADDEGRIKLWRKHRDSEYEVYKPVLNDPDHLRALGYSYEFLSLDVLNAQLRAFYDSVDPFRKTAEEDGG